MTRPTRVRKTVVAGLAPGHPDQVMLAGGLAPRATQTRVTSDRSGTGQVSLAGRVTPARVSSTDTGRTVEERREIWNVVHLKALYDYQHFNTIAKNLSRASRKKE